MRTRSFLLLVLLLTGLMILSSCAPESTSDGPQESPYPYPLPEIQEDKPVQPSEPNEPYPEPQEAIVDKSDEGDDALSKNPYPGIEVVGNTSDLDMSEALTLVDYTVQSDDKELRAGPVYIDRSEIILKESDPVQVELVLVGNLPTPCNQLRVVPSKPDQNKHIKVEAYTVSDPDKMCAQVVKPFIAVIPLGEYSDGTYTVSINNEMNGEFQLP